MALHKKTRRPYPRETMIDIDYADNLALLVNTAAQSESQLHILEQAAGGIGLFVNANKTGFISFK